MEGTTRATYDRDGNVRSASSSPRSRTVAYSCAEARTTPWPAALVYGFAPFPVAISSMRQDDESAVSPSLAIAKPGRAGPSQFMLPQFGIFAQGTHAHHFLEFDLEPGVSPGQAVAAFRQLRAPDVAAGGVNLVVAFAADAWREVAPWGAPADLGPFHRSSAPTAAPRRRLSTMHGSGSAAPSRT